MHNCFNRAVPEIQWHVAGILSNQQTTTTQCVPSSKCPNQTNFFCLISFSCCLGCIVLLADTTTPPNLVQISMHDNLGTSDTVIMVQCTHHPVHMQSCQPKVQRSACNKPIYTTLARVLTPANKITYHEKQEHPANTAGIICIWAHQAMDSQG